MTLHRCLLTAVCLACATAGQAAPSWVLPKDSTLAEVASAATLYGAPAQVLSYRTPVEATALIAFLSRQYPGLRDMAVYPGMAVLADASGPCSRVATVSGQAGLGSRGTLSTICWEQAMSKPAQPAAWLPAGADLVFEFSEPAGQAGAVQQIWQYAVPPGEIAQLAHDGLMSQGWRLVRAPASSGASWQTWRRGTQMLVVDVLGKAEGSVLAVLRFASDPYAAAPGLAPGDAP